MLLHTDTSPVTQLTTHSNPHEDLVSDATTLHNALRTTAADAAGPASADYATASGSASNEDRDGLPT